MKQALKKIGLICILLFIVPLISSWPSQLDQKQQQKSITQTAPESPKSEEEIFSPSNWIARGACWDFSKKIITGRSVGQRPIAYFKKRSYTDKDNSFKSGEVSLV